MAAYPTTTTGRRGVALVAAGVAAYVLFVVLNDALQGLGSPWRVLALLGSQLILLGGGAYCAVAVARHGERALAVYVALVPVVLMLLLILAEVSGLME
jgi:hypothetical protein